MKNILKTALLFSLTTLIISCGNPQKKETHSKTEEVHTHEKRTPVQLYDGNLWLANPETTTGIKNMRVLMQNFSDTESVAAYTTLKDSLEMQFKTILTQCTMTGEAHNQLHNYLVPMKTIFEGLESSDLNTCKQHFNILNKHLAQYKKYFK
jgi:hypothetical protein